MTELKGPVMVGGKGPFAQPFETVGQFEVSCFGGDADHKAKHRQEIERFARNVAGDEVAFVSCSYRRLLADWARHKDGKIRAHADAVTRHFSP